MRMPSLSDSSRSSLMPSSFFSLTRSAIFSISRALFTWYGISVTMIDSRPLSAHSTSARAHAHPAAAGAVGDEGAAHDAEHAGGGAARDNSGRAGGGE